MRKPPSRWEGFSPGLKSQADLLDKLRVDLTRLELDPNDDYAAWDFFVTADHMRDWNQPKKLGLKDLDALDCAERLLLLVVHKLANRGKHFRPENRGTEKVRNVGSAGAYQTDAFDPKAFDTGRLVIDFVNPRRTESAIHLARLVVAWWAARPAAVPSAVGRS